MFRSSTPHSFALLVVVLTAVACDRSPRLSPGEAYHGRLGDGEEASLIVDLERGDFLHLTADQAELDAVLHLYDPEGRPVGEMVDFAYLGQEELLLAVAETAGPHRLTVNKFFSQRQQSERLPFTIETLIRPADPSDRATTEAFWHFTRGINLANSERDCEGAEPHLNNAIRLSRESEFPLIYGGSLQQLGDCLRRQGELDEAKIHLEEALQSARHHQLLGLIFRAARSLTSLEKERESFKDALAYNNIAHESAVKHSYTYGINAAIADRCYLMCSMGWLSEAEVKCREAVAYSEQAAYKHSEASTRNALGWLLQSLGRSQESIVELKRSLELAKPGTRDEAAPLSNLARALKNIGEHDASIEIFRRALALNQKLKRPAHVVSTRNSLARVLLAAGDLKGARSEIDQALELSSQVRSNFSRAQVLDARSRVAVAEGNLEEARRDAEEAFALIDLQRPKTLDFKARALLLSTKWTIYEQRVRLAMTTSPLAGFQAAEQARARSLIDHLSTLGGENNPDAVAPLLSVADIRRQVLADDTVLLQFFLGTKESYLWRLDRQELKAWHLPAKDRLHAETEHWLSSLTAEPRNLEALETATQLGARLFNTLKLNEALDGVTARRVLLMPDAGLHAIPFAALPASSGSPDEAGNPELMIDRFKVAYAPSASVLATQRQRLADRRRQTREGRQHGLAIVADPVLSRSDDRLSPTLQHLEPLESALPRLPQTQEEAAALARLSSGDSLVLTGFEASKRRLLDHDLSAFRYLHFATHGVIDPRNPERTSLALTQVDADGTELDGRLVVEDIEGLRLGADLVVLSACRTAKGEHLLGEGVMGLGRGFMNAGVPRVVASLWTVQDSVTRELMEDFYRRMLKEQHPPADALHEAQLELRKYRPDPYHWAAFVFQGEWR